MSEGRRITTGGQESERRRAALWLVGLLAVPSVLFELGGEGVRLALRYERAAILQGDYLRLLTGHFVHLGSAHLLLNLAGLTLIGVLFWRDYSVRQWLIVLLASLFAIDLGFVLFEPQLAWYVGLSGLLHGALAAGSVGWWRHESRPMAIALSALLIIKLAWEQWHGALPLSGDMPVIVDAHLYGAVGGLVAAVAIGWKERGWPRRR